MIKFVLRQKGTGNIPSDKELQDHARMVIFEDTDPWNWTAADDPQWLDTFKFQQGIGDFTPAMQVKELAEVPIMAPYTIKGGLKNKSTSSRHKTSSVSCNSGNITPECGSMPNSAMATSFDPNMDFDFDNIDFGGLDLGMVDDMTFDMGVGVDGQMGMEGFNVATTAPFPSSLQGEAMYGPLNMNLGWDTNAVVTAQPLQQLQQQPLNGYQDFMTEQDLGQLTGYMSGFKG
jgi:hypothetical protein